MDVSSLLHTPKQRRKSCMTQNAATMAMKISVVWTMGSGMPIVVRRSGGHRGRLGCGRGAGAATQRLASGGRSAAASDARRCSCSPNGSWTPPTAKSHTQVEPASVLLDASSIFWLDKARLEYSSWAGILLVATQVNYFLVTSASWLEERCRTRHSSPLRTSALPQALRGAAVSRSAHAPHDATHNRAALAGKSGPPADRGGRRRDGDSWERTSENFKEAGRADRRVR